MCIIAAKYFDDFGWVGVKNRDRNYIPEISFHHRTSNGVEIMLFWDDITRYSEGFNSGGVCIISASLMVLDDEKEITVRSKKPSKDGVKIKRALQYPNVKAAATSLIKDKLPGNTLIFDAYTMFVRPVQSHITFNFWKLNNPRHHKHEHGEPPFPRMNHQS